MSEMNFTYFHLFFQNLGLGFSDVTVTMSHGMTWCHTSVTVTVTCHNKRA